MSRAIDKATAAALQSGNPEAAYNAIADVLTEQPTHSYPISTLEAPARLEIEFLGRGHPSLSSDSPYVLRDGNAVAIPKLALVQAFLVARKILQRQQSHTSLDASHDDDIKQLVRATAVTLLMDPEHLTAANTRKRILQKQIRGKRDASSSPSANPLAAELYLVDSFLTSHLHRHTKSPTLWNHRRWLMSMAPAPRPQAGSESLFLTIDPLRDITGVILVASIRHPRNYYAWDHARWLVQQWRAQGEIKENGDDGDEEATERRLVLAVRDWCYRHHTDTSGWSFLFFLLASPARPPSPLYAETVAQVEQMAMSLRWMSESVWVFLRTAVTFQEMQRAASGGDDYDRFRETASSLQNQVSPASREHQILQQAQDWCAAKLERKDA